MPRRKGKKKAGEEYLLLYHLSRTGIVPRTDLSLFRGNLGDRYAQQIIARHIKEGHITVFRFNRCDYCFLSDSGVEYLRKQERDIYNRNALLDEYEKFLLKNPQNPIVKEAIIHQTQADQASHKRTNFPAPASSSHPSDLNPAITNNHASGRFAAPKEIQNGSRNADSDIPPVLKNRTVELKETRSGEFGRSPQNETMNFLFWKPGEREPTKPMNPQRRLKLERIKDGIHVEKLRAEIRRSGVKNLLYSTGVLIYGEDKPDYKTFLSILSHPSYADTFLWSALCAHGVFYSREEIVSVETEESISRRIQGVLFTKSGWYAVYNTLNRFIRFYSKLEKDGLKILAEQLAPLQPYRRSNPRSIVFAVGRGMVASMVNGYRYGRDRSHDLPSFISKRYTRKLMTVSELNALYEKVYLVELNSGGVSSLTWLIKSDEESIAAERRALVEGNPGLLQFASTQSGRSIVMDIPSGRETVLTQIYDLTELKRIRDGSRTVNVIAPPWMADAISKSLGPRLGRFISLYGEGEVQVNRYNEYGEKLSP